MPDDSDAENEEEMEAKESEKGKGSNAAPGSQRSASFQGPTSDVQDSQHLMMNTLGRISGDIWKRIWVMVYLSLRKGSTM